MKNANKILPSIKLFAFAAILGTALSSAIFSAEAYAKESSPKAMYKTGIYRINDFDNVLNESDQEWLDTAFTEEMKNCKLDLPVTIADSGPKSAEEYADSFYANNGFGWGDGKDGIILVSYTNSQEVFVKSYGVGRWFLTPELKESVSSKLTAMVKEKKPWSEILNAYLGLIKKRREEIEASGKPAWYPKDVENFQDFHDEEAPRVVDVADIFTKEEEEEMLSLIKKIQDDFGKDIVVFTDVSSYGLSHGIYAADFQQFAGYGFGDDFTGTALLICMESGNRGWWTWATGKCEPFYTEEVINKLDDRLEPYMLDARYGEGVIDYLRNVYSLYRVPDWYPEDISTFEPFHNQEAPRLADPSYILDEEEKHKIQDAIKQIQDDYGFDMAVYIDDFSYWKPADTIAKEFYDYGGYGFGDDYTGAVFYICWERGELDCSIFANGKCKEIYTNYEIRKIKNILARSFEEKQYADGIVKCLENIHELYKLPDWYPTDTSSFVRFSAQDKKMVVDQAGIFSEEQKSILEKKALSLTQKFGSDILILTATNTVRGGSVSDYAKDYALYNGYGSGQNKDALVLCLVDDGNRLRWDFVTQGSERKCYNERNTEHMYGYITGDMEEYDCYKAAKKFLRNAGLMYRFGITLPKFTSGLSIFLGLIVGLICAGKKKKKLRKGMETIQKYVDAEAYYVPDSFELSDSSEVLVNTTESKTYIGGSSGRSGGSSGHRSSYSHYHSSGGRHGSGGGRRF